MVEADNKMWEGHRIIYPKLRDKYLESKKEPFPRPALDEQKLEELSGRLAEALAARTVVMLTLWSPTGPCRQEVVLLAKQKASLQGRDQAGNIIYVKLADILDIT